MILLKRMAVRTAAASLKARRSRRVDIDEEDGGQDAGGESVSA